MLRFRERNFGSTRISRGRKTRGFTTRASCNRTEGREKDKRVYFVVVVMGTGYLKLDVGKVGGDQEQDLKRKLKNHCSWQRLIV